jgi:glycosyltransferase involved in cell wall biosynthesis
MKKYNILLVSPCLRVGGEELSTLSLAKELKKSGHNVYVMTSGGLMLQEFIVNSVEIILSPIQGRKPWHILLGAKHIKNIIKKYNIGIVHSQSVIPTVMSCLARFTLFGKKPKIIWHDRGIKNYKPSILFSNFFIDFVIANSKFEMVKLIKKGLRKNKVKYIHNCFNLTFPTEIKKDTKLLKEFGIQSSYFIVGSVGRLVLNKGFEYLLGAAKLVFQKTSNIKFIIIGSGFLENKLKNLSLKYGIEKNVILLGHRRDLDKIYPIMDIFVLPSRDESLGNVSLEAMAFGKPVIASNVGGVPEVVLNDDTGFLVSSGDVRGIADKILLLLKDEHLRKKMGESGRKRVKKYFTPERVCKEVEKVYEYLVN